MELGLLCVYYDRDDNSESVILDWLKSQEPTPFKKKIIDGLSKIDNVTAFNFKVPILSHISDLYSDLSNYVHTKGISYSSFHLNGSNVNNFNKKTFLLWRNLLCVVVDDLTILFLLKYPIGLLDTPIDEKFGLNGPAGGFLNPHQRIKILDRLDPKVSSVLTELGRNDADAQGMAQAIVDMPDISDEEMQEQADQIDRTDIERMGYHLWYKNMIKPTVEYDGELSDEMAKHIKNMEKWAKENGHFH